MASSEQAKIRRRAQAAAEAWLRGTMAVQSTDTLIARSRALLAQSRQLLTELERADLLRFRRRDSPRESVAVSRSEGTPVGPAVHQSDQTSARHAEFSIAVIEDGEQFGWTLYSPTKEWLGWGTAETELNARVDALQAGMAYIDRLKNRSAPSSIRLN